MSDLISRSALLRHKTYLWDPVLGHEACVCVDDIESAPTIDAVPVDKIQFTDLYLDGIEAIAVFKFGNQGITLRKKCEDFVPVVHGRWIPTYHKYYNRDGECMIADEWHCSECGVRHRDKWNYCPNCGANMRGDTE